MTNAAEISHEVADLSSQRSPGAIGEVTFEGTDAIVPLTAQMFFAVLDSFAGRIEGMSDGPAIVGIAEYVSLTVGVPPPRTESETVCFSAS